MKICLPKLLIIPALLITGFAYAAEHEVGQKNKKFSTDALTIKAGDSVKFTNNDPFFHNVFSLSDTIVFDLGSYEKGKSKSIVFDTPGVIEVECAIHPAMLMTVTVE